MINYLILGLYLYPQLFVPWCCRPATISRFVITTVSLHWRWKTRRWVVTAKCSRVSDQSKRLSLYTCHRMMVLPKTKLNLRTPYILLFHIIMWHFFRWRRGCIQQKRSLQRVSRIGKARHWRGVDLRQFTAWRQDVSSWEFQRSQSSMQRPCCHRRHRHGP